MILSRLFYTKVRDRNFILRFFINIKIKKNFTNHSKSTILFDCFIQSQLSKKTHFTHSAPIFSISHSSHASDKNNNHWAKKLWLNGHKDEMLHVNKLPYKDEDFFPQSATTKIITWFLSWKSKRVKKKCFTFFLMFLFYSYLVLLVALCLIIYDIFMSLFRTRNFHISSNESTVESNFFCVEGMVKILARWSPRLKFLWQLLAKCLPLQNQIIRNSCGELCFTWLKNL
jgi:hypothetical protein